MFNLRPATNAPDRIQSTAGRASRGRRRIFFPSLLFYEVKKNRGKQELAERLPHETRPSRRAGRFCLQPSR
ncbi:hypothetical protein E2C01_012511 [Portunus trituberculatus]|uniref:Uncharacterized protein n=1 Tax=Portunus trituberculatus TaxID=210409 RepID=A0A5B7DEA7_PORTR|nr:hypothetical protein [Portunus trituberculatus]